MRLLKYGLKNNFIIKYFKMFNPILQKLYNTVFKYIKLLYVLLDYKNLFAISFVKSKKKVYSFC